MNSRKLILVKHSLPEIVPSLPANEWHLSKLGRARSSPLAQIVSTYLPAAIVSSTEPKAIETAQIVAEKLGQPFEIFQGLHEHERSHVEWLGAEPFEKSIADLFARPDQLVFGEETANAASTRFANAVSRLLEKYPRGNIAVVAHGTVISLYVSRLTKLEPFAFWKRLDLPSVAVLTLPNFELDQVIEKIEA